MPQGFAAIDDAKVRLVRWLLLAAAVCAWAGLLAYKLHFLAHGGHQIDDSYMFTRYAEHVRHGLGFSWNLDGVHTYGMTTLLWAWLIIPVSLLPLQSASALTLATWLTTGAAIGLMSQAIWSNAQSKWLRDRVLVLALVTLTLVLVPMFDYGAVSGMETMLGFAMLAWLIGLVLRQRERAVSPELIGFVAVLLFLSRPESLLVSAAMIFLGWFCIPNVRASHVVRALLVLFVGVALVAVGGKLYFGSWLPLSFYVKAKNGYVGYQARWYPFTYALTALKTSAVYALAIALFAGRRHAKMLALTFAPLVLVTAYLCTVTQIMGFHDRYYLPYLPLLAIPAFLVVDTFVMRGRSAWGEWMSGRNAIAALLVMAFNMGAFPYKLQVLIERHTEPHVLAYKPVVFDAPHPAPATDYFVALNSFADGIARFVPAGTTIASSEVGYLGAAAPQANILDTAGLNDAPIALHGFDPAKFLARAPDIIWLPHDDYTYQRGILLTNPEFLRQYDFYAGAFNYGFAVRKDSPARASIEQHLATVWPKVAPGTTPQDALVHHVEWPAGTTVSGVSPPKY